MLPEHKILQIIPANGWVALYNDDKGETGPAEDGLPVVCFALIQYTQDGHTFQEVRPMTDGGGGIEVEDCTNYAGVVRLPGSP
jgi:hypothetical protein